MQERNVGCGDARRGRRRQSGQRLFTGQFFLDDEVVDIEYFRKQASAYGFPEGEYIQAVQDVPRLSRNSVSAGLKFLTKLANMLSELIFANSSLSSLAAERQDLLERERYQTEKLSTLIEMDKAFTSSLNMPEVIARALAGIERHLHVAASSVWTLDVAQGVLHVVGARGFPNRFMTDFATGVRVEDAYPISRAVRNRTPVIFRRTQTNPPPDPVADAYASYGIELASLCAVPLVSRGAVIGALTLAWTEPRPLDADEVAMITTLGSRFAVGIENAKLFQTEHMIAETLQDTLVVLPSEVPGVSFSRSYETATYEQGRVGGDFIDVFPIGEGIVGISLGDVSGKGLEAAVTTSMIRTTLRIHALDGLGPAAIVSKLNHVLWRVTEVATFATLWFGVLDSANGQLRYVCAAHPAAQVMTAKGELSALECTDPIIGAFDHTTFQEHSTVLAADERLLLYSDGATEARSSDGAFLGDEGLAEMVVRHRDVPTRELADCVMSDVVRYSEGVLRDDVAILAIGLSKTT